MPQLTPDVFRLIAEQLKQPIVPHVIMRTADVSSLVADQAALRSLCCTSRDLDELCSTILNRDAYVYSMNAFLKSSASQRVERLYLYHRSHSFTSSYLNLLQYSQSLWYNFVGMADSSLIDVADKDTVLGFAGYDMERKAIEASAIRLRDLLSSPKSAGTFSRLRQVVLGGVGDMRYFDLNVVSLDQMMNRHLPLTLLNVPTVEHVCQSLDYGPLTLPEDLFIKPAHDIKTFTHHWRPHTNAVFPSGIPIVVGAINRFIFGCPITTTEGTTSDREYIGFLTSLVEIISPRHEVLDWSGKAVVHRGINKEDWNSTTIEIYDFIRCVRIDTGESIDTQNTASERGKAHLVLADQAAGDLAPVQRIFDELLGPGKGTVILKNREECPPCAACGFDRNVEHADRAGNPFKGRCRNPECRDEMCRGRR